MRMLRGFLPALLVAAAACGVDQATGPDETDARVDAAALDVVATTNVAGDWSWSETTVLKLRPAGAGVFGLVPEGPITHVRCESGGILSIAQNGSNIGGSATQASTCTTKGGVEFVPAVFPPGWTFTGELRGRSLRFTVDAGFACHYRGSTAGGVVRATGACEVPKELGSDKILGFVAHPN